VWVSLDYTPHKYVGEVAAQHGGSHVWGRMSFKSYNMYSETLVACHIITRYHNVEDYDLNPHGHESLKSRGGMFQRSDETDSLLEIQRFQQLLLNRGAGIAQSM